MFGQRRRSRRLDRERLRKREGVEGAGEWLELMLEVELLRREVRMVAVVAVAKEKRRVLRMRIWRRSVGEHCRYKLLPEADIMSPQSKV